MRGVFPSLVALMLGGCYELQNPVFTQGERAPIVGIYQCTGMFLSRRETISETSTGYIWKNYRYTNAAGETLTLRKMPGTHYAAEINSKQGTNLVFLDIASQERFSIRVPDLVSQGRAIDALIAEHHVQAASSKRNADFIAVTGDDKALVSFIKAHTPTLLTTIMDCNRIGS